MTYRNFAKPDLARGRATTSDWMQWMRYQGDVLIPIAPKHPHSCQRCFGAVKYRDDGDAWPVCWQCRQYGAAIDTFVPITYSVDAGLESMLHRYKDRDVDWLRCPLASLLTTFVRKHADCIDDAAHEINVAAIVPPNSPTRSFNHLEDLLHGISGDPVLSRFAWNLDAVVRNRAVARPDRGELKPSAYKVDADVVDRAAVLLLDDTWTSGASAASTAAALKEAGAVHVTVLTLGRQLNTSNHFGSSETIYEERHRGPWNLDQCILCS